MNSCSTKYRHNPPSLVLYFTYSSSPNSCSQLTLPILFFNLVVESTIELQLQFQVTLDEYYKYAIMIPRGPINSHYKKLDLWQRLSNATISPKNTTICPLGYSGVFYSCIFEHNCCTMTLGLQWCFSLGLQWRFKKNATIGHTLQLHFINTTIGRFFFLFFFKKKAIATFKWTYSGVFKTLLQVIGNATIGLMF